jgi:aspartyl protease family protein
MFRSTFFSVVALIVVSFLASSFLSGRVAQRPQVQTDPVATAPASPPPSSRSGSGDIQMAIAPDRSGNYLTDADIDGHLIRMIVDTGATFVCLTDADASAIGIRPAPADYRYRTATANGVGIAAKVQISRLRLGQMEVYDVEAFVMPPGALGVSLLGMSALRRLGSVEISGGQLLLRQ